MKRIIPAVLMAILGVGVAGASGTAHAATASPFIQEPRDSTSTEQSGEHEIKPYGEVIT